MIIFHTPHLLFLLLVTSCVVFFPNVEEVSILFKILSCLGLLMTFVMSRISLILSLFLSSSRFLIISVNSSGLFCKRLRRMPRVFRCYAFSDFVDLFVVLFLLIQIPNLSVLLGIFSGVGLRVIL